MKTQRRKILILAVLALGFFVVGCSASVLTEGLVAYWPFDETEGEVVFDASGNEHHGTIHQAMWEEGVRGTGLAFDGESSRLEVLGFQGMQLEQLTVALWVKLPTGHGADEVWYILDSEAFGLAKNNNAQGTVEFLIRSGESKFYSGRSRVGISDDAWHLVVGWCDGSEVAVWIDGVKVASSSIDGLPGPLNEMHKLYIGAGRDLRPGLFTLGVIDEVRIYNRALSEEEIAQLYQLGLGRPKE